MRTPSSSLILALGLSSLCHRTDYFGDSAQADDACPLQGIACNLLVNDSPEVLVCAKRSGKHRRKLEQGSALLLEVQTASLPDSEPPEKSSIMPTTLMAEIPTDSLYITGKSKRGSST